jgi:hypothetical protein
VYEKRFGCWTFTIENCSSARVCWGARVCLGGGFISRYVHRDHIGRRERAAALPSCMCFFFVFFKVCGAGGCLAHIDRHVLLAKAVLPY